VSPDIIFAILVSGLVNEVIFHTFIYDNQPHYTFFINKKAAEAAFLILQYNYQIIGMIG
jgi:hypothetical protein